MLISGLDYGGAEQVVFDLSEGLIHGGHEVVVCCMLDRAARAESFHRAGIPLHLLRIQQTWWHWKNLVSIRKTHKILLRHGIDIVHAHMMHALVMAVCLKLLRWQRRVVFTRHNIVGSFSPHERLLFKLSRIFREADIVFSPSELNAVDVKSGVAIPNGILCPSIGSQTKSQKFIFLTVGMFRVQKNYTMLPKVVCEMVSTGFSDFEIWMCGQGDTLKETQQLAAQLNVSQYFRFLGLQSSPGTFYEQAHTFLLPSLYEGLPLAVLEAACYGLPVIATPVGVLPDYFDESEIYFTSHEAMAGTMIRVARNQAEAQKKGERLQQKVHEEFLAERMVARHIGLYGGCVK